MTELQERYGGRRRTSHLIAHQLVALVLIAALVVSAVGLLAWAVLFQSTPQVTSQLTGWDVSNEHLAVAHLNVSRESQFTHASCQLRAVADDHSTVGEVTVPVTDGPEEQSLKVEIRTEREATSVESLGCSTPDQTRRR